MKKHILIQLLTCCLLLLACATSVKAQTTLPTPEVLYYRFDGVGNTVPNLASAPPVGTATANIMGSVSQGGTGLYGGALIGSGNSASTDYLNTGWAPAIGTSSWTISFWTSGIGPNATLYYIFGDANSNQFRCFTNGIAGPNNWVMRGAGLTDVYVNGGATGAPHMTTFVYDNTANNVYAYLDGVLVSTVAQGAVSLVGAGPFKVMGYGTNVGSPAGGLMDEFRFYSHALTATDVSLLFQRITYDTISVASCVNPYISPSGNHSWTVAGTYSDTLVGGNMYGGDSILSINLSFASPVTPNVTISSNPNDTICGSQTVVFTANTTNGGPAPSYQWYKNGFPVGVNAPTYTEGAPANGDVIACVLTSSNPCAVPVNDTDTVHVVFINTSTALAGNYVLPESRVVNVSSFMDVRYYTDCDLMASINPTGANPISGNTTVTVTKDLIVNSFNGQPYVQRHFDIEPANNPGTSTATIMLYAYQSEFDAYNVAATAAGLPLLPTGAINNGNVRVTQFHGVGTAPGNYPGSEELIIPAVNWDATNNWWVMVLPVTGFSGFYIHTAYGFDPLDIAISNISAQNEAARNRVDWTSATETRGGLYTIQRSVDGKNFTDIGTATAKGIASAYTYWDEKPFNGINYYRIKMDEPAGKSNYTKVVDATVKNGNSLNITASPNPVRNSLGVAIYGTQTGNSYISVTDLTGKELKRVQLSGSTASIDLSSLAQGVYMLKYTDDARTETMKIVKE